MLEFARLISNIQSSVERIQYHYHPEDHPRGGRQYPVTII